MRHQFILRRICLALTALIITVNADAMFKWKSQSARHVSAKQSRVDGFVISHADEPHSASKYHLQKTHRASYHLRSQSVPDRGPGFGITSLIFGFAGLFIAAVFPGGGLIFATVFAAAAIVLGALGFNREGKGKAIAGFCLGVGTLLLIALIIVFLIAVMGV